MELMQDVRAYSLREQVLQHVRSQVMSGRVPAGTVYSVPSLAAELKVSTTTVREALLVLCGNHLLTALPNRGFRVEGMTQKALDDLFTMRELVERFGMETLARKGIDKVDHLLALADDVADAVKRRSISDFIETDMLYHQALLDAVGNPLLTQTAMKMREDMRLYGIESPEGWQRQLDSAQEHYDMIALAQSNSVAAMGRLTSKHILAWKPLFKAALNQP